jgi:predicted alpha/beta superfamily hydrolase
MVSSAPRAQQCAVTVSVHYSPARAGLPPPSLLWLAADPAHCSTVGWELDNVLEMMKDPTVALTTPGVLQPAGGLGAHRPTEYTATLDFDRGCPAAELTVRCFSPDDPKLKAGGGFATAVGSNTVFSVPDAPAATLDLYPSFTSHAGTVETIESVESPQLGNSRPIHVYLPPSFYENAAKPLTRVVVQWDGATLLDPFFTSTVDAATLEGAIEELVVIGIPSIADVRMNELTPTMSTANWDKDADAISEVGNDTGQGDKTISFVLDTVLPLVVAKYGAGRLRPGKLGIGGYSLGGLMSCYALFSRRDAFDRANCGSSSMWWDSEVMGNTLLPQLLARTPAGGAGLRCWLDVGTAEGDETMVGPTAKVVELLGSSAEQGGGGMVLGRDLHHDVDAGAAHAGNSFLRRLRRSLVFLYPPPVLTAIAASRL